MPSPEPTATPTEPSVTPTAATAALPAWALAERRPPRSARRVDAEEMRELADEFVIRASSKAIKAGGALPRRRRLDPELVKTLKTTRDSPVGKGAAAGNRELRVLVKAGVGESLESLRRRVEAAGGRVTNEFAATGAVAAEVAAGAAESLSYDSFVGANRAYAAERLGTTDIINASGAWASGWNGSGVRIAILDSGVDSSHEMLAGRVVAEKDFTGSASGASDVFGHGTHVAGIAAGNSPNGLKGVAPGALIINAKVLDDSGTGSTESVIKGIEWALDPDGDAGTDDGAKVMVMSLGGAYGSPDLTLWDAIRAANGRGAIVVVASGNCGAGCPAQYCNGYVGVTTPGDSPDALTVGAVDENGEWACFSGGRAGSVKPDVTAPGVNVESSVPGGYRNATGTSMATPFAAGAAALLLQKNPGLPPASVKALLEYASRDAGAQGKDERYGSGVLNAAAALAVNLTGFANLTIAVPERIVRGNAAVILVNSSVPLAGVYGEAESPSGAKYALAFDGHGGLNWAANFTDTEEEGVYAVSVFDGRATALFEAANYSFDAPAEAVAGRPASLAAAYKNFEEVAREVGLWLEVRDATGGLAYFTPASYTSVAPNGSASFDGNWAPNESGVFYATAFISFDGSEPQALTRRIYAATPRLAKITASYPATAVEKGSAASFTITAQSLAGGNTVEPRRVEYDLWSEWNTAQGSPWLFLSRNADGSLDNMTYAADCNAAIGPYEGSHEPCYYAGASDHQTHTVRYAAGNVSIQGGSGGGRVWPNNFYRRYLTEPGAYQAVGVVYCRGDPFCNGEGMNYSVWLDGEMKCDGYVSSAGGSAPFNCALGAAGAGSYADVWIGTNNDSSYDWGNLSLKIIGETGGTPPEAEINATAEVHLILGDRLLKLFDSGSVALAPSATVNITAAGKVDLQAGEYWVRSVLRYGDRNESRDSKLTVSVPPKLNITAFNPPASVVFGADYNLSVRVANNFTEPIDASASVALEKDGELIGQYYGEGGVLAGGEEKTLVVPVRFVGRSGGITATAVVSYEGNSAREARNVTITEKTSPEAIDRAVNANAYAGSAIFMNATLADDSRVENATFWIDNGTTGPIRVPANLTRVGGNVSVARAIYYGSLAAGWRFFAVAACDELGNCLPPAFPAGGGGSVPESGFDYGVSSDRVLVKNCSGKRVLAIEEAGTVARALDGAACVSQWQPSQWGAPSAAYLRQFDVLVWNAGNSPREAPAEATSALANYAQAGRIFMAGSRLGGTFRNNPAGFETLAGVQLGGLYAQGDGLAASKITFTEDAATTGFGGNVTLLNQSFRDAVRPNGSIVYAAFNDSSSAALTVKRNAASAVFVAGFSLDTLAPDDAKRIIRSAALGEFSDALRLDWQAIAKAASSGVFNGGSYWFAVSAIAPVVG